LTARVKIDVGGQLGQGSHGGRGNLIKSVCAQKGISLAQFNWVLN